MMGKNAKIWLIIAASLMLIGCAVMVSSVALQDWDIANLSTDKYETNEHEINTEIQAIKVDTDTADVEFIASNEAICSVVCYEQKNAKHSVEVKDGTLVIELVDTRKWYEHIGINFGAPKITVYIPQGEYGDLSVSSDTGDVNIPKEFIFNSIYVTESTGDVAIYASVLETVNVKTSTGRVLIEDVSAKSLDISVSAGNVSVSNVKCEGDLQVVVSTGKAELTDLVCRNLTSRGSTGDIKLKGVIVSEGISVERSTGDVTFDDSDAAEIYVETDTGDVKGSLLTEKIFVVKTDTGRVSVPKSTLGGRCEIITDTGDILIDEFYN